MTKKELIEMISDVPDDARIQLVHTQYNLIDISTRTQDIEGFYEHNGCYILCGLNVKPNIIKEHD